MNVNEMYKRAQSPRTLFIIGAVVLLLTILFVRVVRGDPSEQSPGYIPPGAAILDEQTAAANDARTNAAEQQDAQNQQDWQNGLRGALPSKDESTYVPPVNVPDPPPQTGIVDKPELPSASGTTYHVTNGWGGVINGQTIGVIAGSKADDITIGQWSTPEQGVLVVNARDSSLRGEYLTPSRTGQITITSYSGNCLYFASTGNTTYLFDVATRQWSCSVNEQPSP